MQTVLTSDTSCGRNPGTNAPKRLEDGLLQRLTSVVVVVVNTSTAPTTSPRHAISFRPENLIRSTVHCTLPTCQRLG